MIDRRVLIRLIVIAGGAGIILLSLFAFQLGLDNDPGWGPRRYQILGAGLAFVLFGALYWITPVVSRWFGTSIKPAIADSSLARRLNASIRKTNTWFARSIAGSSLAGGFTRSKRFGWISKNRLNLWLIVLAGCALWSYVWIISIGRIEKWPSGRNYYWMLTQAFQNGQTYLLVEPNPELLELENPYDLAQRKGLDYLWDTTLYKGKYYLYWGPVPAVLGVLINFVTSKPVSDAGLVFLFVTGTVLFSVLLLKLLYQDLRFSGAVFWGGTLALAMNVPTIWLFTHPAYYEASIAGGQFFIMAGFFLFYLAFRSQSLHKGFLALAALSFGLAGGTRVSLLPSVIFLTSIILWRIYTHYQRKLSSSIPALVAAILPLATVALSLGWYNYVRFGSIFEFGHRYQLTGLAYTENYGDQASISYLVPNFYTYMFRFPSVSGEFPFVTVPWIKESMWPSFIHLPENYYYPEPVAGVLFVVPLIGFAAIVMVRLVWLLANGDISLRSIPVAGNSDFRWLGVSMLGYVLIQLCFLLVFVSSSMRYLVDVTPALILLTTMFVGIHVQSFEQQANWKRIILLLWLSAAVLTVLSGFLIGITGGQDNFQDKNPQLYYQLMNWFSR